MKLLGTFSAAVQKKENSTTKEMEMVIGQWLAKATERLKHKQEIADQDLELE